MKKSQVALLDDSFFFRLTTFSNAVLSLRLSAQENSRFLHRPFLCWNLVEESLRGLDDHGWLCDGL